MNMIIILVSLYRIRYYNEQNKILIICPVQNRILPNIHINILDNSDIISHELIINV